MQPLVNIMHVHVWVVAFKFPACMEERIYTNCSPYSYHMYSWVIDTDCCYSSQSPDSSGSK